MKYSIPYGESALSFTTPEERVIFTGEMTNIPKVEDMEEAIVQAITRPIGAAPLDELARGKKNIVFLIEDATRSTPLAAMMPIIVDYLNFCGVPDDAMSFLTAPGTHRILTDEEITEKIGPDMVRRFKVRQHDATIAEDIADLGSVNAGG